MPHLSIKYDEKARGSTFRKIGWRYAARFLKPLPYFTPKSVIFPTLFQTWSKIWCPTSDLKPWSPARDLTSCYGMRTYTVGVGIKREMVLSPNDEEVASSKENTQFKSRLHKPHPISHPIWRHTYLYSLYKEIPPPRPTKNALQIMSLAAYASETNEI